MCFFWLHIRVQVPRDLGVRRREAELPAASGWAQRAAAEEQRQRGHGQRRRAPTRYVSLRPSVSQSVSQSVVPSVVLRYGYCNCAKGAFGSHAQPHYTTPTVVASLATHTVSGRRFLMSTTRQAQVHHSKFFVVLPYDTVDFHRHSENQAWLCVLCPGCENQASQGPAPMRCTFTESLYR